MKLIFARMSLLALAALSMVAIGWFTPQSTRAEPEAGDKGKWVVIGEDLAAQMPVKNGKSTYEGTAGVAVDPAGGIFYLELFSHGLYRSTDHGKSFEHVAEKEITGRCETGFNQSVDPKGKRLAISVVYGNSARSEDGGKTWTQLKTSHVDCIAVDWTDTGKTMLAVRHESGGKLALSVDAGQTWKDLDKGFEGVGVFDANTLIGSKTDGIYRTTDAGATWAKVSELKPAGLQMKMHDGAGYFTSDKGLIVSKDKGSTWSILGSPVNVFLGPEFGKEAGHIVAVGKDGVMETTDNGATWKIAAPLAPNLKPQRNLNYFAWDAEANVFYASTMSKPAYRWVR